MMVVATEKVSRAENRKCCELRETPLERRRSCFCAQTAGGFVCNIKWAER